MHFTPCDQQTHYQGRREWTLRRERVRSQGRDPGSGGDTGSGPLANLSGCNPHRPHDVTERRGCASAPWSSFPVVIRAQTEGGGPRGTKNPANLRSSTNRRAPFHAAGPVVAGIPRGPSGHSPPASGRARNWRMCVTESVATRGRVLRRRCADAAPSHTRGHRVRSTRPPGSLHQNSGIPRMVTTNRGVHTLL